MKALERLEELLDERDLRITKLEEELSQYTETARWEWAKHGTLEENQNDLPVPRMEIRWYRESEDGYLQRWDYDLIYRHFLGHLIRIPFGQTRIRAGSLKPPICKQGIETPFRDGVHIVHDAIHLGLQAFAICDGRVELLSLDENGQCKGAPYTPSPRKSKLVNETKPITS